MSHYEPFHQDLHCLQHIVLVCRTERVKITKHCDKVKFTYVARAVVFGHIIIFGQELYF